MTSPWTPELTAQLRQHWSNGLSASKIEEEFKGLVTRNAVIGKVHRLGLETRKTTKRLPHVNGWTARKANGYVPGTRVRAAGTPKPKRPPRDRKSVKGVSQAPWSPPRIDETAIYETMRRTDGAMRFIDTPNTNVNSLCKWFLSGESGALGLQCCAAINDGSTYCDHHRAVGTRRLRGSRLEAAE